MRHLVLLFIALAAAYALWQLGGRNTLHRLARHALRLGAGLVVLVGLLVLAYNSNALKLL